MKYTGIEEEKNDQKYQKEVVYAPLNNSNINCVISFKNIDLQCLTCKNQCQCQKFSRKSISKSTYETPPRFHIQQQNHIVIILPDTDQLFTLKQSNILYEVISIIEYKGFNSITIGGNEVQNANFTGEEIFNLLVSFLRSKIFKKPGKIKITNQNVFTPFKQ